MQVDRALRSEEGTVVENRSLSRRVARVVANGESGDGGGGMREHRPWERRRFLFIGYPRFGESNRPLRVGGCTCNRGGSGRLLKHRRRRDARHS